MHEMLLHGGRGWFNETRPPTCAPRMHSRHHPYHNGLGASGKEVEAVGSVSAAQI